MAIVNETKRELLLDNWVNNPFLSYTAIAEMSGVSKQHFIRCRKDPEFVARYHEKCKARFAAIEAKAVAALEKQIEEGSFQATKYALDAAGYAAAQKIEMDAKTTFTINVGDEDAEL